MSRYRLSRGLLKRRLGDNADLRIELPNMHVDLPARHIRRDVPGLYRYARATGNRRLYPYDMLSPSFQTFNDLEAYNDAMNWVFTRVGGFGRPAPAFSSLINSNDQTNIFRNLVRDLSYTLSIGDIIGAEGIVAYVLEVFMAISKILRSDSGFGHGISIFWEVLDNAIELAPYIASVGPGATFQLVKAVYTVGYGDILGVNSVDKLIRAIGPFERDGLSQVAWQEFQLYGDLIAYDLFQTGLLA